MSDFDEALRRLEELRARSERRAQESRRRLADMERERRERVTIIRVDKRTHRVRFEGETEDEVAIVVEPKGGDTP